MREIKFRAWGSFGSDTRKEMVDDWQDKSASEYVGFNGGGFFSVMQYTGLKDKDGKDIYEGDIVRIKHPFKERKWTGAIVYDGHGFTGDGFFFTHFDEPYDLFSEGTEYIEVIGNIYENPELLNAPL
jgi:uncharacterized phage protein (TIGR01671 family)